MQSNSPSPSPGSLSMCPQPSHDPSGAVAGTPFPRGWSAPPAAGFTGLMGKLCASVVLFTHQLVSQELARPRRAPNHEELKQVILQK